MQEALHVASIFKKKMKCQKIETKILDVHNDLFYECTKNQYKIIYTLGCANLKNYRSKVVDSVTF
jgi:hypothetical protein